MNKLAPSILSADFSRLVEQVGEVENAGADIIHVDVMDGHFVPNISFGADVMKSLIGKTNMPFDVHLMIEEPDRHLEDFMCADTRYITVHQEACVHLNRTLRHIRDIGARAGVAVNPATPLSQLECILDDVDMVLIMSVNPGFGGQKFIESSIEKIRMLKEIREKRDKKFEIEVDGGITLDNIKRIRDAGATVFVAGSSVFKSADPTKATADFVRIIKE